MSTYAEEMKKKYGVPYNPKDVKSSGGFHLGDRVVMDSDAESWQSGVKRNQTGTVSAIKGAKGLSVCPDPAGKIIYVKWDDGQECSVWKGTLKKTNAKSSQPASMPHQPPMGISPKMPPLR